MPSDIRGNVASEETFRDGFSHLASVAETLRKIGELLGRYPANRGTRYRSKVGTGMFACSDTQDLQ